MKRIWLVARRGFAQVVSPRAFKIPLLIVPLILGVTMAATSFLRPPPTTAYVMADAQRSFAAVIEHRVELEYQGQVMRELSAYAARLNLTPPSDNDAEFDDAAV